MTISFFNFLILSIFVLCSLCCNSSQTKSAKNEKTNDTNLRISPVVLSKNKKMESPQLKDSRDGEVYSIVAIGKQIWMAENLRYDAPGSKTNPDYPSKKYGRVYDGKLAQNVCPEGWHLPSDVEWNRMEMVLGMNISDIAKTFWRGTHGKKMKSEMGWLDDGNGTNTSGFNVLPAGFYFSAESKDEESYFDGLGGSAGYWTALDGDKAWVRFLGGPLKGVNRFDDDKLNWMLACRCIKN